MYIFVFIFIVWKIAQLFLDNAFQLYSYTIASLILEKDHSITEMRRLKKCYFFPNEFRFCTVKKEYIYIYYIFIYIGSIGPSACHEPISAFNE